MDRREGPYQPALQGMRSATEAFILAKETNGDIDMSQHLKTEQKKPSLLAIRRAVASSTAIETGQGVAQLERQLQRSTGKFRNIALAN